MQDLRRYIVTRTAQYKVYDDIIISRESSVSAVTVTYYTRPFSSAATYKDTLSIASCIYTAPHLPVGAKLGEGGRA